MSLGEDGELAAAKAAANDPQWKPARDLVCARVEALCVKTGQRGSPAVSFNPALSHWKNALNLDVGSPSAYHCVLDDKVAIDLPMTFGTNAPSADTISVDLVDGLLLHELGHRRDRWIIRLSGGHGLVALLLAASVFCLVLSKSAGLSEIVYGALFVATLAVGGVFHLLRTPIGRWLERRADDYVLDHGGETACTALMDGLDTLERTGGGPGQSPLHNSAADRRQRQIQRAS